MTLIRFVLLFGISSLVTAPLFAVDATTPNIVLILADEKNNLAPQLPDFVSKTHVFFEVCAKLV